MAGDDQLTDEVGQPIDEKGAEVGVDQLADQVKEPGDEQGGV